MILSDQEAALIIKSNTVAPKAITDARSYSKTLAALISGENFQDVLIRQIEKIEGTQQAEVRKKYSRDITDMFTRLFAPIQNVFSAMGGVKNYTDGDAKLSEDNLAKLLHIVSNVRDGKSIESYIQLQYTNFYHIDPAGVIYLTYTTDDKGLNKIYPVYFSIGSIRNYLPKGQLVEWILFEPDVTSQPGKQIWKIIDDQRQRTFIGSGEDLALSNDPTLTFDHPFSEVPAIINSDLIDKYGNRISPIHNIQSIASEFARDQSIKTIYKFLHGFPKHWRLTPYCLKCKGTMKDGKEVCSGCGGTGLMGKDDVTGISNIPPGKDGQPPLKGDDIMGYVAPDLDTLKFMNEDMDRTENMIHESFWGVGKAKEIKKSVSQTEDEIHRDTQPMINKLNCYSDIFQWVEWTLTEWIARAIDTTISPEKQVSRIVYSRAYILEGMDELQQKYEDAKKNGDNIVILDGIFYELLTIKFKNDMGLLNQEIKKAGVEPYLHQSIDDVNNILGPEEAVRKMYFQKWWKNLTDADLLKEKIALQIQFDKDFLTYLPTVKIQQPINKPVNPAAE